MKKRLSNTIIIIITLIILYLITKEKILVKASIYNGINIWYSNILPSLLPSFIISDILINYNIISYIPNKIKIILKNILNISENQLTILILSIISGSPSNARNIKTMYDNKILSIKESNHMLLITHFNNPIFILSTISILFNNNISIILIITQYISNIIIALIFKNNNTIKDYNKVNTNNKKFSNILLESINNSINTILLICGIITIFSILSNLLLQNFNIYNKTLLTGFLELTNGLNLLKNLNLSNTYKLIISVSFLSFGGLSIHMQVKSLIINTPIEYKYFLAGRIYQLIISIPLAYLLTFIIPI